MSTCYVRIPGLRSLVVQDRMITEADMENDMPMFTVSLSQSNQRLSITRCRSWSKILGST